METSNALLIDSGEAILGIELGSTRIKAVLIDTANQPIAQGGFEWEKQLIDGIWTYDLADVETGIQACFASLQADVKEQYDTQITRVKALGISAMMHGCVSSPR